MAAPLELNRKTLDRDLLALRDQHGAVVGARLRRLLPSLERRRDFRGRRWRQIGFAAAILAFVAMRWQMSDGAAGDLPEGSYPVARVLSGDTLELANHFQVRMLGVEEFGRHVGEGANSLTDPRSSAAIAFVRNSLADGKVRLQFERTRLDSDGHYLAYVWIDDPHGSRLLNEELLRGGWLRAAPKSLSLCASPMKRRLTKAAAEGNSQQRIARTGSPS
jgi:endonuclease YncB( thermonuclease family)